MLLREALELVRNFVASVSMGRRYIRKPFAHLIFPIRMSMSVSRDTRSPSTPGQGRRRGRELAKVEEFDVAVKS
jgi:hypothetical protein